MITSSALQILFILLVVFQLKHFIADFPLQIPYMLNKLRSGWSFVVPLSLHCLVHAIGTLLISLYFAPNVWWLCLVDFVIHFVMDRIKSGPRYLGRFNDQRKSSYWIALGFDQMVHHLTHLYLIWVLIHNMPALQIVP